MTATNPYRENATKHLSKAEAEGVLIHSSAAETAQAAATLALAFEQRTANLIAFAQMMAGKMTGVQAVDVAGEIVERLGLTDAEATR
jgi:hypothetical protein